MDRIPLLNYGYETNSLPEDFSGINEWMNLGSPVPNGSQEIVYKTFNLKGNLVLLSYPLFISLLLLNSVAIMSNKFLRLSKQ